MKAKKQLAKTKDNLKSLVSDAAIANKYLGIKSVPFLCKSPLREDKKKSFCYYSKDGTTIMWVDYAKGESGDLLSLLSKMWNISYAETIRTVWDDMLGKDANTVVFRQVQKVSGEIKVKSSKSRKLGIKTRKWNKDDVNYWGRFGIDLKTLAKYHVYPAAYKVITKEDEPQRVFKLDPIAYAYVENKEGKQTMKIYQPFNKEHKWDNSHTSDVIALWSILPENGDVVIICSSVKDALCLHCNTGYDVIAVQGEAMKMSETAVNELKRRFRHPFILFDSDRAGREDARKLSEATGFDILELPESIAFKDIAEFYEDLTNKDGLKVYIDIQIWEKMNTASS